MPPDSDMLRVFYDGDCPRCRRFAARHAAADVTFVDLESGAAELLAAGVSREAALRAIHALPSAGGFLHGIDAVAAVWRRQPGLRWLAALVSLPGVRALALRIYAAIATRRRRDR